MQKLFGKNIEPSCLYCEFGRPDNNREKIFCSKKGIVNADFSCRKFKYDPIKRIPKKIVVKNDFEKNDFEL